MVSRKVLLSLDCLCLEKGLKCWTNQNIHWKNINLINPDRNKIKILKEYSRRYIFRIFDEKSKKSYVVKSFPFTKFYEKRRYKKYGLREFNNYQQAISLSMPTPECYGYFEYRDLFMVKVNGILIEDLQNYENLVDKAKNKKEKIEFYLKAIPIILLCFMKGVNHIDITPFNVLINDKNDIKILDWHYCHFVEKKQESQLLLHAAHFLKYAELEVDLAKHWLEKLYEQVDISMSLEDFLAMVAKIMELKKIKLEDRLNLNIMV